MLTDIVICVSASDAKQYGSKRATTDLCAPFATINWFLMAVHGENMLFADHVHYLWRSNLLFFLVIMRNALLTGLHMYVEFWNETRDNLKQFTNNKLTNFKRLLVYCLAPFLRKGRSALSVPASSASRTCWRNIDTCTGSNKLKWWRRMNRLRNCRRTVVDY